MFGPPASAPQARPLTADRLFESLLKRGLIIRQLKSYKLPHLLRVSVGNMDENRALIKAMLELIYG
jgi:histidinol-phosphate aminotransferase